MALMRVSKAGGGASLDLTGFTELTLPLSNATDYSLIVLLGTASTGGVVTGITIGNNDPSTNKFSPSSVSHGTGGSAVEVYIPTIASPNITVSASASSGYTAQAYVKAYGLPK